MQTPLKRRCNLRVPLRDKIMLASDVVLPEELPAPAVVMRTPYGRGGEIATARAWLTALERPPALGAMIVLVNPSDPFVEDPTGLPGPMHVHWDRMTDGRALQYTEAVDWTDVYGHRPLIDLDEKAGFESRPWRTRSSPSTSGSHATRVRRPRA
ncbi:MAG TPA: hypothetical protein VMD48_09475 [Solirubrobacteraceae bacterium]|nr:hypothetical protein [Solirubrobacteraceae bacterium]